MLQSTLCHSVPSKSFGFYLCRCLFSTQRYPLVLGVHYTTCVLEVKPITINIATGTSNIFSVAKNINRLHSRLRKYRCANPYEYYEIKISFPANSDHHHLTTLDDAAQSQAVLLFQKLSGRGWRRSRNT